MLSTPEVAPVAANFPGIAVRPDAFDALYGTIVKLVEENPSTEAGHPKHGTRIFLEGEDRITSAILGWEEIPYPTTAVTDDGQLLELNRIAHVNLESEWSRKKGRQPGFSTYFHTLTAEGVVLRVSYSKGVLKVRPISTEATAVLAKRLGYEEPAHRAWRAAQWQLKFALSDGPKSPSEAIR